MANAVVDGIKEKGGEAALHTCEDFDGSKVAEYDAIAFGCPAMGAEVIEEDEMEPFVAEVEGFASGKTIGLFGSYGWGDGEWMRTWEKDCSDAGLNLVCESVICADAPDDAALEACRALGKALVE